VDKNRGRTMVETTLKKRNAPVKDDKSEGYEV
jgi:hypothetical protein